MLEMTDKQLEEKKEQFVLDTNSLLERELTENDLDIIFHWISKLVEEVEREKNVEIIKRLKEYQLGLENYIEEYGLNRIESIKVNEFGIKDN